MEEPLLDIYTHFFALLVVPPIFFPASSGVYTSLSDRFLIASHFFSPLLLQQFLKRCFLSLSNIFVLLLFFKFLSFALFSPKSALLLSSFIFHSDLPFQASTFGMILRLVLLRSQAVFCGAIAFWNVLGDFSISVSKSMCSGDFSCSTLPSILLYVSLKLLPQVVGLVTHQVRSGEAVFFLSCATQTSTPKGLTGRLAERYFLHRAAFWDSSLSSFLKFENR